MKNRSKQLEALKQMEERIQRLQVDNVIIVLSTLRHKLDTIQMLY